MFTGNDPGIATKTTGKMDRGFRIGYLNIGRLAGQTTRKVVSKAKRVKTVRAVRLLLHGILVRHLCLIEWVIYILNNDLLVFKLFPIVHKK